MLGCSGLSEVDFQEHPREEGRVVWGVQQAPRQEEVVLANVVGGQETEAKCMHRICSEGVTNRTC